MVDETLLTGYANLMKQNQSKHDKFILDVSSLKDNISHENIRLSVFVELGAS